MRDNRLTSITQAAALVSVLVAWLRHRKDPVPAARGTFREVGRVERPGSYYYR